jgi:hypothetical protein
VSNQISAIRTTLNRIRGEIRQEQNKALGPTSKRLADPRQAVFWARLARYEADLRRIHRDLVGRLSSLDHQRVQLWNVPRDQRYYARQSIDDREAITEDLGAEAAAILRDLLKFYGDVSGMKPGDWQSLFEELTKFGDKVNKEVFHTVVQQVQKEPAITKPGPIMFSIADFAPLVGLIVAMISSRFRKRSQSATSE